MPSSRDFNGTTSDYLVPSGTVPNPPSPLSMSFAAWIKIPTGAPQSVNGYPIIGMLDSPPAFLNDILITTGVASANGQIVNRSASSQTFSTLGLGDLAGQTWFVGMTISGNGSSTKFYAGTRLSNIGILGTSTAYVGFPSVNPYNILIGKSENIFTNPFLGTLSQIGLWWGVELTLSQLITFAGSCGLANSVGDLSQFYYPITGASPEPDLGPNAGSATVHGTTVVSTICISSINPESQFACVI